MAQKDQSKEDKLKEKAKKMKKSGANDEMEALILAVKGNPGLYQRVMDKIRMERAMKANSSKLSKEKKETQNKK